MSKAYSPVLDDKGFIELVLVSPEEDMDTHIANCARVSFLGVSKGVERDTKLIQHLMKHGHTSPFEMGEFTFRMRAPLVVYWQLVRHRMFKFISVNAQSGRYTEFTEDAVQEIRPNEWRKQAKSNKQASDGYLEEKDGQYLSELLLTHYEQSYNLYQEALKLGVAREQARYFLPGFAVYYTWVVKTDLWNLMSFLKLRLAEDAQYEIRQYAQKMYEMAKRHAPISIAAAEEFLWRRE